MRFQSLLFVILVLAATGIVPGHAQDSSSPASGSHSLGLSPDTPCDDVRLSRTVAPVRLSINNMETVRVHGLHIQLQESVALDERTCYSVKGLEVGALGSAYQLRGVSIGLGNFAQHARGTGVNLGNLGDTRSGIFVSGLFGVDEQAAGVSIALFKNSVSRGYGVFAGGWNDADHTAGWMVGAINGSNRTHGIQTGLLNSSLDTKGVQIGLYNRSDSLRGVQIGLMNVVANRDGPLQRLPLINASW